VGGKFQGQVVGISRSIGGGNYQGQVVGEIIKVKWWGYQGQLVGEIIKVKWWGYLGQVVGISRPSGGDIKVRGRGLEVKVKKKWWGVRALSNSLYYVANVWAMLSRYQNAAAASREFQRVRRAISRKTPSWATSVINLVQRRNRQDRT
jgi:hypothetical protein